MNNNFEKDENFLLEESLKQLEFFQVLDIVSRYCNSELGQELILKSRPREEIFWLNIEHQLIEETTQLITQEDPLPIDGLSDTRPKFFKSLVQNAVLSPVEILEIRDNIRVSRLMKNYFSSKREKYPALCEESERLYDNRILEKHIEETIDDAGEVKDNATKELSRIRRSIKDKSHYLRNRLQKILKKVTEDDLVQEDFYSVREGRFVLPIKVEHKRHIPGIIHGVSQTGSTVFLEPSEIIEMNNELSLLSNEEKREIYKILANLTEEIGKDANHFLQSLEILGHIDSVYAKAKYALDFGGIRPEVTEENIIELHQIRHPLLMRAKGKKNVEPMSIDFSDNIRGHLISGPNAGGKTVALKSIGLNILMALSGIFPLGICKTNFRRIFSSIGDHQSIENDLSTFSSQIIELKDILSYTEKSSLVLIDEIGSGTDPQEGAALAAGILDTLLELHSFFVATTHQSSLKTYALTKEEIQNASLEFDSKALKPTYKFLSGIPGNSYAFVLAKNFGVPDLILDRARKYIGTNQSQLEESISLLQKYKSEAEEFKIQAEQEKIKAEKYRIEYEEKLKEIKLKKKDFIGNAQEHATKILRDANAIVEKTIREIREEKRPIIEIKKDFSNFKSQLESEIAEGKQKDYNKNTDRDFEAGDTIIAGDSNNSGTIITVDKQHQTAVVEFNGLKFKMSFDKMIKTKKKEKLRGSKADYLKFETQSTLDLRGMRAGEALAEVDNFISSSILSSVQSVTIIHGKGTGALRQAVHDFLASHPSSLKFRLGNLVEGGDGVTIVDF